MISPAVLIYRPLEIPYRFVNILEGIALTTYARDVFDGVAYVESEIPILDDLDGFVLATLGVVVWMVDHIGRHGV